MVAIQRRFFCSLAVLGWTFAASFGQSATPSSQQAKDAAQSSSQSTSQSQTPEQDKGDSVAEAARKAKAKRAAAAQSKVFTEEDLSGMKGGVSVVGDDFKKPASKRAANSAADKKDDPSGEEYWRGRARPLLDGMAAIDQRIAQLQEEIKKNGAGGFDVQSGFKDNVAYIEDRNGQIQTLQRKKADLQKQLDDLEEEGRKAGAQPAWFR